MNKKLLITFIIIIILICFLKLIDIKNIILKIYYQVKYEDIINRYSEEYDVDKYLVLAIIKNESNFNKNSTSNKDAKGLMQLLDSTAKELAKELEIKDEINLFDEEINIRIGTYYISKLLKYYNNLYLAISAYNAGMGNVNRWIEDDIIKNDGSNIENIPYKETENYLRKVIRDYNIYKNYNK